MGLKEQLKEDYVKAMKAQDKLKVSTLRMLSSSITNAEIAAKEKLDDEQIQQVVSKEVKKRKEAAQEYRKGNREELAEKEDKEAEILSEYMPEQMSEEELRSIIEKAIGETGAQGKNDMGKVMGKVMPQVKGKADGTLVNKIASSLLENNE